MGDQECVIEEWAKQGISSLVMKYMEEKAAKVPMGDDRNDRVS